MQKTDNSVVRKMKSEWLLVGRKKPKSSELYLAAQYNFKAADCLSMQN